MSGQAARAIDTLTMGEICARAEQPSPVMTLSGDVKAGISPSPVPAFNLSLDHPRMLMVTIDPKRGLDPVFAFLSGRCAETGNAVQKRILLDDAEAFIRSIRDGV